jgi:hypothetical protein
MPDLVIGSRRASPGRALRATGLLVALGATALVVAWFIYRRSVAYDVPDGEPVSAPIEVEQVDGVGVGLRWSEARLTHVGGLTVVRAAGEPFAIGAAHGRLLGPRLPATLAGFGPSIDALAGDGGWFGFTQAMRKDWRLRFVDDGITDRHRRGLAGLVRGAAQSGVDRSYQEVLRTATVLDIGQPSATTAEGPDPQPGPRADRGGAAGRRRHRSAVGRTELRPARPGRRAAMASARRSCSSSSRPAVRRGRAWDGPA